MMCYLLPQPTRDLVGSQDTSSRNHLQHTRSPNHSSIRCLHRSLTHNINSHVHQSRHTQHTKQKGAAKNTLLCRGGCRSSTLQGAGGKCAAQLTKDPHGEGSVLQAGRAPDLHPSLRRQPQLQDAQHMRCMYTGYDEAVQGRRQGWITPRPPLNQSQGSCDQDSGNNMLL